VIEGAGLDIEIVQLQVAVLRRQGVQAVIREGDGLAVNTLGGKTYSGSQL
jgi:hypothetical protein